MAHFLKKMNREISTTLCCAFAVMRKLVRERERERVDLLSVREYKEKESETWREGE